MRWSCTFQLLIFLKWSHIYISAFFHHITQSPVMSRKILFESHGLHCEIALFIACRNILIMVHCEQFFYNNNNNHIIITEYWILLFKMLLNVYFILCLIFFAAFALNDSPVGLAAYILEKFSTWTNSSYRNCVDGCLTSHFTLDDLLTNVMIYWVTGTIGSSMRFYKENFGDEEIYEWDRQVRHWVSNLTSLGSDSRVNKTKGRGHQWAVLQLYMKLLSYSDLLISDRA